MNSNLKFNKVITALFCIFSFFFLSCSKDLLWDNPFDPDSSLESWAPSNLIITPIAYNQIKLTWSKSNYQVQGYKISRKVGTGAWQEDIATVNANVTEWTDTTTPIGSQYYYKVKAFAGTHVSTPIEQNFNFILSAPTNLTITPQTPTSIKLSWQDSNQFEQGFKISRKVGTGAWQEDIAVIDANVTEWLDINAQYGTTYTYKIKAYAGENTSMPLENNHIFILSAPTNLTITSQTATSIKLTWQDINQFEQGFKISRKIGTGAWQENIAIVNSNETEWTDNNVNNVEIYYYKVRAYCQGNYSTYSNLSVFDMMRFVLIEGGTFQMGSTSGNSDETPIHSVTLSSFFIGKYEVTQAEWQTVMTGNTNGISATPSHFSNNSNHPVERVSWYAIMVYANRRSIQEGLTPCYSKGGISNPDLWGIVPTSTNTDWNATGYRLPTEAEWEFAARGGNQSNNYTYSGSNTLGNVAWYYGNSGNSTNTVGTKAPNELGIYDMSGNVWEWCWDWYSSYSSIAQMDPHGSESGSFRVFRGGSWNSHESYCSLNFRNYYNPNLSDSDLGFRLVRSIR